MQHNDLKFHNVAGSSDEAYLAAFLVTLQLIPRGRHELQRLQCLMHTFTDRDVDIPIHRHGTCATSIGAATQSR